MRLTKVPGAAGLVVIIAALLAVCEIITQTTGTYSHWLFVVSGILMGLLAVRSINR